MSGARELERTWCTYGQVPGWEEFIARYVDTFGKSEPRFTGKNDPYAGTYSLSAPELHTQLVEASEAWEEGNEEAGNWASAVLDQVGIEWV